MEQTEQQPTIPLIPVPLACHKCGTPLNCVCGRFIVSVHEEGYESTCFACEYHNEQERFDRADYARRRMEEMITNALSRR